MPQINDLTLLTSPTGTESAVVSDAGGTLRRVLVAEMKDPHIEALAALTSLAGSESVMVQEAGGAYKKALVSVIAGYMHPIGSAYTQYYGLPTPATLYGGTWALMYNTSAVCFMTEGTAGATYEAETFDGIVYDSQMQGHVHETDAETPQTIVSNTETGGSSRRMGTGVSAKATSIITDGTNGPPRVGKATKPRRVIVRVWQRTA